MIILALTQNFVSIIRCFFRKEASFNHSQLVSFIKCVTIQ